MMENKEVKNICRTCLSYSSELSSLFKHTELLEDEVNFCNMVTKCASVQVIRLTHKLELK